MFNRSKKTSPDGPTSAPTRRIAILIVVLLLAGAAGGAWFYHTWGVEETDDAYVDGHIYTVTPRVDGYVTTVPVEDNQRVKAGQVLVELDPTDLEVALAQARADLSTAESELAAQELGVPLEVSQTDSRVVQANSQLQSQYRNLDQAAQEEEVARQAVASAEAQEHQAALDMERYEELRSRQVVAQSAYDTAHTALLSAQAELRSARANAAAVARKRDSLQQDVNRLKAEIRLAATGHDQARIKAKEALAQRARVELERSRVKQAELNLSYTRITAPVDGFVTKRNVEPGQQVAAGQKLLAVVPLDPEELWITANFKETQLENVRPGQRVDVAVDTYPGRTFPGRVDSIMAGTGSAFSLFPPENSSGNFVKVVQRVPVKIVLDAGKEPLPELRVGMSVVPVISTR
jgi:membrane fusion protein (multidrug efflux system)